MGVSRQSVHGWVGRYLAEGFARFGRSVASADELPTPGGRCGEVAVPGMRCRHPRWGWEAIRIEWLRQPVGSDSVDRALDQVTRNDAVR